MGVAIALSQGNRRANEMADMEIRVFVSVTPGKLCESVLVGDQACEFAHRSIDDENGYNAGVLRTIWFQFHM